MAEQQLVAEAAAASPSSHALNADHAPSVPSPLNPEAARARPLPKPIAREQREKKETLKKRESTALARGATPDAKAGFKPPPVVGPQREGLPVPELHLYDAPRDLIMVSHEPEPSFVLDTNIELKKPIDCNYNRPAARWQYRVADPLFPHTEWFRKTEIGPFAPHMSMQDSDKHIHFDDSCNIITNHRGWRMARANVFAREGSFYHEVKILNGIPPNTPAGFQETTPQPHVRVGFCRRESPTDVPIGYDAYSYGITDTRCDTIHRSRLGKFVTPRGKKGRPKVQQVQTVEVPLEPLRQGDVIGLLITLPSLGIHRKVVAGTYNPAVDFSSAPDPDAAPPDIVRDHITIASRNVIFAEQPEYQPTKALKQYSDRAPVNNFRPHANHEEVPLRTLPQSSIRLFRNGVALGTAFEELLAFLPPASLVAEDKRLRQGFDDGTLGYYPAVAVFNGGITQTNFGPDFWFPPAELKLRQQDAGAGADVSMENDEQAQSAMSDALPVRPFSDRYYEQIAEDTVWDIIDEASYYVEDGGVARQ